MPLGMRQKARCDDGLAIEGSSSKNHAYFLAYSFSQLMCLDSYMVISRHPHHIEAIFYQCFKSDKA